VNIDKDIAAAGAREVATKLAQLCAWVSRVSLRDIPETILRRAATVLCDDIAAIVAARDEPEVVKLQGRIVSRAGSDESTIFDGRGGKADRFSAAVANGAAADWCELDEGYRRATCHAGLYVIPALIAEAEATGASTEETLRALVLGYEVATRFARAFPVKMPTLHPHASLAAIGAAAGVGALRGLDAALLNSALTSASTMVAPGPYGHAVEGALVRNVWPAAGAWCGMQAVEWAECGIGGTPHSPYDVFVITFGAGLAADQFSAGLGEEWALADGYHKVHACCQYSHSAVEAIMGLHDKLGERMQGVRGIAVETHPLGMTLDNREPATSLAAKFSMPHIAAAACLFGNAGAEAFAGARLNDAPLAALREKVELVPYENVPAWPNDRPARVTVVLDDGSKYSEECISAGGGPDKPFGPEMIKAKIDGIMAPAYPNAPQIIGRCLSLDRALLEMPWRDVVVGLAG
jgi:2-methylcitrate dehydratase PrpD